MANGDENLTFGDLAQLSDDFSVMADPAASPQQQAPQAPLSFDDLVEHVEAGIPEPDLTAPEQEAKDMVNNIGLTIQEESQGVYRDERGNIIPQRSFAEKIFRLAGIAGQRAGATVAESATAGAFEGGFEEATGGALQPESFLEEVATVVGDVAGQASTVAGTTIAGGLAAGPVGAGVGLVTGIGATLYNAIRRESEDVYERAKARGATEDAARAASQAASVNIAVTEGISLIPVAAFFGKFGKVFKAADLFPDRVVHKMRSKVFDTDVANALSKLERRAPKIAAAVRGGVVGGVFEGTTESVQGGINDAIVAVATGESPGQALAEALDPERRGREFLVAGLGAGLVIGAGAGVQAQAPPPESQTAEARAEGIKLTTQAEQPFKDGILSEDQVLAEFEKSLERSGQKITEFPTEDALFLGIKDLADLLSQSTDPTDTGFTVEISSLANPADFIAALEDASGVNVVVSESSLNDGDVLTLIDVRKVDTPTGETSGEIPNLTPDQETILEIQGQLTQLQENPDLDATITVNLNKVANIDGLIEVISEEAGLRVTALDSINNILTVGKIAPDAMPQVDIKTDLTGEPASFEDVINSVQEMDAIGSKASFVRLNVDTFEGSVEELLNTLDEQRWIYDIDFETGEIYIYNSKYSDDSAYESIAEDNLQKSVKTLPEETYFQENTTVVPAQEPDQSGARHHHNQPADMAAFESTVDPNSLPREQRQNELNKHTNTREGAEYPAEIVGADNTAVSSGTGVAWNKNADVPYDPIFGGPEVIFTELAEQEYEAMRLSEDIEGVAPNAQAGFQGGLRYAPVPNTRNTNAPEVIFELTKLAAMVGGTVREASTRIAQGRISKNVLGFYNTITRVVRTQSANDIPVAAHEVGHLLDDVLITNQEISKSVPTKAKFELGALGKMLYKSRRPHNGYRSEGWAEFFRIYTTRDRAVLKEATPETFAWFEEVLSRPEFKNIKRQIDKIHGFSLDFQAQTPSQRAKNSLIGQEAFEIKMRNMVRKLQASPKMAMQRFMHRMIEEGDGIQAAENQAREIVTNELGRELRFEEKPYFIFNADRGTVGERAAYMINKGMIDYALNSTGVKSLAEAIAPVQENIEDFKLFLWAKRAIALHATQRNPGLRLNDANDIVEQIRKEGNLDRFEVAAQDVYNFLDGVMNYAAQAAPLTIAPMWRAIKQADPGYYIPLHREFENLDNTLQGVYSDVKAATKTAAQGGILNRMRLKGSGRRVQDPLEGILQHTGSVIAAAHNRAVLESLIRIGKLPGMSKYITEIDPRTSVPVRRRVTDIISNLKKISPELKTALEGAESELDLTDMYTTLFILPNKKPAGEMAYVPLHIGGKLRWFEVDGGVYDGLISSNNLHMDTMFQRLFLELPNRTFRAGTTSLNASFSLGTNVIRDFRTFHVQTQSSASTPVLLQSWFAAVQQSAMYALSGGTQALGKEAMFDFAEKSGVFKSNWLSQDANSLRRASRQLTQSGFKKVTDIRNIFDFYSNVLSSTESATRIAEMKLVAKEMGIDLNQPHKFTPQQAREILLAGKEVTTDFSAAGRISRTINKAIPFFNAAIQGPRALGRAGARDPVNVALRLGQGAALAAGLWFLHKDEDWWQDLDPMDKYLYTWIPFEANGRKEMFRFPRAFEIDGISMAMTEAMLDSWYTQDPKAVKEYIASVYKAAIPGTQFGEDVPHLPIPLPVLMDEMVDQLAGVGGRDHFFNRPIVPEGMVRNLPPEQQFFEYTSRTAQSLGNILKISPIRIEHAIRGITGSFGIDLIRYSETAADVLDEVFGADRPDKEVRRERELREKLPIFGVFLRTTGDISRSPRVIDELYKEHSDMMRRRSEEDYIEKQKRLMLKDALDAISTINKMARLTASVDKRREMYKLRRDIAVDVRNRLEKDFPVRGDITSLKKQKKAELDLLETTTEFGG